MEKNNRKVASTAKQAALSTLGERLHAARINAGLTQQRVAERLEATLQSVRNWEPGMSEPSEEVVDTLAALYGVLSPHLTGQASDPRPENSDQPPYQRVDVEPRLFREPKKDVRTVAVRGILTGRSEHRYPEEVRTGHGSTNQSHDDEAGPHVRKTRSLV